MKNESISYLGGAYKLLEPPKKDLVSDIQTLVEREKRLLKLSNEVTKEKILIERELGGIFKKNKDQENLHIEIKRLLDKSDKLIAESLDLRKLIQEKGEDDNQVIELHLDFFDRVDRNSEDWDKAFKWAAKYYPEFKCWLKPNPYENLSDEELEKSLKEWGWIKDHEQQRTFSHV